MENRFIRWEMEIEGIPVDQAATQAFEAGLAEAISAETGEYTELNSTVVVRRKDLRADSLFWRGGRCM